MKVEIEDYRGQSIWYDDDYDKFVCEITIEDRSKSAKRGSLKDLRKEIDQFIKLNLDFKPFKAIAKSSWGGDEFKVVEVTAIRTDNLLVVKGNGYGTSHYGKKESEALMKYDYDIVKEQSEIEAEYDKAFELKKSKLKELSSRLVKLDLSKYDLK